MRIIAGQWRGTHLHTPKGAAIRPTADRLRESIFNMIGPRLQGSLVLDLFAGTGAMGLEALSRGASHATLIDRDPRALALIRRNVDKVRAGAKTTVMRWDIAHNLRCLGRGGRFDWVFIDPPYGRGLVQRTLVNLSAVEGDLGRIIVEHDDREIILTPTGGYRLYDQRRYGKTLVSFLDPVV